MTDTPNTDLPLDQFRQWFASAETAGLEEPASMVVSSVDADGRPNSRVVLCRGIDRDGLTFFTNLQSPKGEELLANPYAALNFHWMPLKRQVRMRGPVQQIDDAIADAYWDQRPRQSQVYSLASTQSAPIDSRAAFEAKASALASVLADDPVIRPPHWTGLRVNPDVIEFWSEGENRFHTREQYTRTGETWTHALLSP